MRGLYFPERVQQAITVTATTPQPGDDDVAEAEIID